MRLLVLLLVVCASAAAAADAQPRSRTYPLRSSRPLDRDALNRMLDAAERSGQRWTADPRETTFALLRHLEQWPQSEGPAPRLARTDEPRRAPRRVTMVVTFEGLQDDSIAAERLAFVLVRSPSGRAWRLEWASVAVRCWPGRGVSDAWIGERCL